MLKERLQTKSILLITLTLCLCYLIFQLWVIPHQLLTVDEFWFAHHIYEYTKKLPYRDFPPYKTVLGYYLLSFSFISIKDILSPLYHIKDEIAVINTFALVGISIWGSRLFNSKAVLLSLVLLIASPLFLVYGVDLRVDMLATWFGVVSLLCILSQRMGLAGIALAISFLVSQKALWFFIATNLAFLINWACLYRNKKIWNQICIFNLTAITTIAIYIFIYSAFSNFSTVIESIFYEAYLQSKITFYSNIYYRAWQVILTNNAFIFLLWPLTWLALFIPVTGDKNKKFRPFIGIYSTVMMLFLITYQQPFPYNMVFGIPVFYILYADFFTWLFLLLKSPLPNKKNRILFWFISIYTIFVICILTLFGIALENILVILIPLFIGLYIHYGSRHQLELATLILLSFFGAGILHPLQESITYSKLITQNQYQKNTLLLANELLKEGGGYIGGVPFLYNQDQSVDGLRNLIDPAVTYLYKPEPAIRPLLLASLYMQPRSAKDVIQDIKDKPIKLYINNGRMDALPNTIRNELRAQFQHYWGSVYLYAPHQFAGEHSQLIKFSGRYQIETGKQAALNVDNAIYNAIFNTKEKTSLIKPVIQIDKKIYFPNSVVTLVMGKHRINSNVEVRLRYVPDEAHLSLGVEDKEDRFLRMLRGVIRY